MKTHHGKSYYYYYYIISAIVLQAPLGVASAVIIKQSSFSILHSVSKASTAQLITIGGILHAGSLALAPFPHSPRVTGHLSSCQKRHLVTPLVYSKDLLFIIAGKLQSSSTLPDLLALWGLPITLE